MLVEVQDLLEGVDGASLQITLTLLGMDVFVENLILPIFGAAVKSNAKDGFLLLGTDGFKLNLLGSLLFPIE
jgi:hypothetical protein